MNELKGRKAISHERIVDEASHAVRRLGYHGVNVTEVMRAAGLTHGGFYAHFASRDALLSAAVTKAGAEIIDLLHGQIDRLGAVGASPVRALVETYLSMDHVRDCENGCPLPILCAEMPRQASEVIGASRRLIDNLHRLLLEVLPAGTEPNAAWPIASALVGAVQLARALGDGEQASIVLADTKSNLLARYDT
jgi:TetR/AcrR family transcriptional regulator, transcriptional repressor for nem operon